MVSFCNVFLANGTVLSSENKIFLQNDVLVQDGRVSYKPKIPLNTGSKQLTLLQYSHPVVVSPKLSVEVIKVIILMIQFHLLPNNVIFCVFVFFHPLLYKVSS
jgi:hypothetical protein